MTGNLQLPKYIQNFGNAIIQNVSATSEQQNIIISPLSIQTILTLLSLGAENPTKSIMDQSLSLGNMTAKSIGNDFHSILQSFQNNSGIAIANAIYLKEGYTINSTFNDVAVNQFYALIQSLVLNANGANIINNYVSNHTNGNIQEIVSASQFSSYTRMILVNAVYFNGGWVHQFPIENTANASFYTGICVQSNAENMQMMNQLAYFRYTFSTQLNAQVLELPYRKLNNVTLTMIIILPKHCDGINDLMSSLNGFELNQLNGQKYQHVNVFLPKFSIKFSTSLNDNLKQVNFMFL